MKLRSASLYRAKARVLLRRYLRCSPPPSGRVVTASLDDFDARVDVGGWAAVLPLAALVVVPAAVRHLTDKTYRNCDNIYR